MNVKEEEIRPEKVFNEYLELTKNDIDTYFGKAEKIDFDCPVCKISGELWIEKSGFQYKKCNSCLSIYVSPRPIRSAFDAYYTDSPSTKFWATTFYKVTESARREKLWKPKAESIAALLKTVSGEKISYIIDIGGGYGVFDEEIRNLIDVHPIVIEPSVHLAEVCRQKNLQVIEKFMEDLNLGELPCGRKCFVSFELFEHLHDPTLFLEIVYRTMEIGDIFIFTTLSGMGLDILVLGENAKALSPPHHLNFMNPKSISKLLENLGFKIMEARTPGKLDIDILNNGKQYIKDNFWKNFIEYANSEELESMQNFISSAGLSSHMMIACKK